MKKSNFKRIVAALLASATVTTMGIAATACAKKHTHKFVLDWDATNHWTVCKEDGETTAAEAHYDNDGDGKCDFCSATISQGGNNGGNNDGNNGGNNGGNQDENLNDGSTYITLNVHKDSNWPSDNVIAYVWGTAEICGGWGDTQMIADGNGWYHANINMDNCANSNEYHLIISDGDDSTETLRFLYDLNYAGSAFTLWFAKDGRVCDSKAAVETYEAGLASVVTTPIVFHFQAPGSWTLTGDLMLYAYNDDNGIVEYSAPWGGTIMTSSGGGWYTVTLNINQNAANTNAKVIFADKANNDEATGAGRVGADVQLKPNIWVTSAGAVSYTQP